MKEKISNILAAWFKKLQRYKVYYKNGSYHLNHLFQSPETIVESFDKMPFCTHDRKKKLQLCDSMFVKSKMYYCQLEKEMWVIVSNLYFKKNVLMRNLYDKHLPLEYHFINIHIKATGVVNKSMVNGLVLKDKTWSMFKAGHAISEYHFKNSEEKNITVFFTSKWLEKQKSENPIVRNSKLAHFFDSSNTYLILDEEMGIYERMHEQMMQLGDTGVESNAGEISKITFELLHLFVKKLNTEIISKNHFKLSDRDRKNIQRAEQYLRNSLCGDFPGVEKTAAIVGVSPTKLKSDFKSMHGITLYQYFSLHQMQLARQLLEQKQHSVKHIAELLGYENASKFSAAFKKRFEVLPSTLIEELKEH